MAMGPYAHNEAKRYLKALVAADPQLTPTGPTVVNTETSLLDPTRLFFDLDDGTRIEVTVMRYER